MAATHPRRYTPPDGRHVDYLFTQNFCCMLHEPSGLRIGQCAVFHCRNAKRRCLQYVTCHLMQTAQTRNMTEQHQLAVCPQHSIGIITTYVSLAKTYKTARQHACRTNYGSIKHKDQTSSNNNTFTYVSPHTSGSQPQVATRIRVMAGLT